MRATVKVGVPKRPRLERADGFKTPAGHSVVRAAAKAAKASASRPPGIADRFEPVQRVFAVTMEILSSRMLFKWLNRRSQRRSLTWSRYARGLARWMPSPRIVHRLVPGHCE